MKKLLTIALLGLTIVSQACWFTSDDWQVVWIDSVNNTSITPSFGTFPTVTAAECGTINIPATGMILDINNSGGYAVTFGATEIIASTDTGRYACAFYNDNGTIYFMGKGEVQN